MPDPRHISKVQGGLANLLSSTLVAAHPWLAEISTETQQRVADAWKEGLEAHQTELVSDLVGRLLEDGNPGPELRTLIEKVTDPSAQFGSIVQTIFVGGLVFQLAGAMLAPFVQEVQNNIWSANPTRPLSPADLAVGAVRGIKPGDAPIVNIDPSLFGIANESGLQNADFQFLADIGGSPPSPQELLEMFRRGLIDLGTVDSGGQTVASGLQEGDTRDEWIEYYQKLAYAWMTPLDFVRAAVQDQMDPGDAETWAAKTGLDTTTLIDGLTPPDGIPNNMFGLAFAIAGRPPGPEEAGRMANRGIINWTGSGADVTTFQQAIAESDIKTKWTAALQALQVYVPPPRTIGTLLKSDSITADQAQSYWEMGGVPAELAAAYVHQATTEQTEQEKVLAKGDVVTGYYDGLFTNAQATELLGLLGYDGTVAANILAISDARREIKALNAVVTRVGSYYTHYKMDETTALDALDKLGIPSDQAQNLLSIWTVDRIQPVRLPSAHDIGYAVKYGTITPAQGLASLEVLGYTPYDAAIVLSANAEQQITPVPGQTSGTENV